MQTWQIVLIATGVVALIGASTFLAMHEFKPTAKLTYPGEVIKAFQQWNSQYNKVYSDPDFFAYRLGVFYQNYQKVMNHPKNSTYTIALNKFADMTNAEFKKTYLGLMPKTTQAPNMHVNTGYTAAAVNWTEAGKVTPVKNQAQCGSCWAFSTTGSTEASGAIQCNNLQSFSEEQLVQCSKAEGNEGCNGGLMDYAFTYIINQGGISLESQYPYTSGTGVTGLCKKSKIQNVFQISTYTDVASGNCDDLQNAITQQPVSIGVDAETWQLYSGGILPAAGCGTQLDHGVLATGYDTSSNWYVKNSWGADWGMSGYIWLENGNACGICNTASYPTAKC